MSQFDAVVLSDGRDERHLALTQDCVRSLRRQSPLPHIIVGESCPTVSAEAYGPCTLVRVSRPFNFNVAVRSCLDAITEPQPYVLISNNDVTYAPGVLRELGDGLTQFDSVCPWTQGHHTKIYGDHALRERFIPGHAFRQQFVGWSYAFRQDVLAWLTPELLFPPELRFWYQDNYFLDVLRKAGCTHALASQAWVQHEYQQSHDLMENPREMTYATRDVYAALLRRLHDVQLRPRPQVLHDYSRLS